MSFLNMQVLKSSALAKPPDPKPESVQNNILTLSQLNKIPENQNPPWKH